MKAKVPREVELKFDLRPSDAARVGAAITDRLGTPARSAQLASVYYDTAAHALADAGITLRVRLENGRATQTVKRSQEKAAALFDRDEWETPLASQEPDVAAFADTPAGASLSGEELHLRPVFETRVERMVWNVSRRGACIEVALDRGRVVAGKSYEELAEIELELKAGVPADLFGVLREIDGIGGLRPGVETKSERGYRLAQNEPHRASKAAPLRLNKHMTAADAFVAIVHTCLRHFGLNAPLVVGQRSPEALHQARVALRRLRSALSLFAEIAADARLEPLKAGLREISSALGEARDLDVYLARSADPSCGREPGAIKAARVRDALEHRRRRAYDDVVARLNAPAMDVLLMGLVEWVETGPWRTGAGSSRRSGRKQPVRGFAAEILHERRDRVVRRGRRLATLDPHARHRVRIEAKKLRYAAKFFGNLARGRKLRRRHGRFVHALEDLQEALGGLNDVQTGRDLLRSVAIEADGQAGPEPRDASDAHTLALLRSAGSAHRRLKRAKPFWSRWRD